MQGNGHASLKDATMALLEHRQSLGNFLMQGTQGQRRRPASIHGRGKCRHELEYRRVCGAS